MTPEKVISSGAHGYLALFDPCLAVGVAGALSRFCIQFAPCALESRRRLIAPSKDSPGYFSPLNRRQVAPDTLMLVRLWISSLDIPESMLWPHIMVSDAAGSTIYVPGRSGREGGEADDRTFGKVVLTRAARRPLIGHPRF